MAEPIRTLRSNVAKTRWCGSFGLVETAFRKSLAIDSLFNTTWLATVVISTGQLFIYHLHVHQESKNKGRDSCTIFFSFGCTLSIWKFLDQGSNPCCNSDPSCCSDNPGSLTQGYMRKLL